MPPEEPLSAPEDNYLGGGAATRGWWASCPGAETACISPFSSERSNVMASGPAMTDLIVWARTTWSL